ncbi:MAG: hypothetical protein PHF79_01905 [Candidatus Pacebacteria bacterium]|nr:hypothetical protein [Candidatus Paceibacterota bacterium]
MKKLNALVCLVFRENPERTRQVKVDLGSNPHIQSLDITNHRCALQKFAEDRQKKDVIIIEYAGPESPSQTVLSVATLQNKAEWILVLKRGPHSAERFVQTATGPKVLELGINAFGSGTLTPPEKDVWDIGAIIDVLPSLLFPAASKRPAKKGLLRSGPAMLAYSHKFPRFKFGPRK